MKMAPPASPRRGAGTYGSTVGAASAINAPPASPEAKRQTKNHENDSGMAHAKNATVASAIIARRIVTAAARAAMDGARSAPAR